MAKNSSKSITAGWPIPESLKESFVNFCNRVGTIVQEDCAGALFIWQHLPAGLRETAKLAAKGEIAFDKRYDQLLGTVVEVDRLVLNAVADAKERRGKAHRDAAKAG